MLKVNKVLIDFVFRVKKKSKWGFPILIFLVMKYKIGCSTWGENIGPLSWSQLFDKKGYILGLWIVIMLIISFLEKDTD